MVETKDSGMVALCRECLADERGEEWVDPVYPPGSAIPTRPNSDGDIHLCAICRRARREDDQGETVRLWSEEVNEDWWDQYSVLVADAQQAHRDATFAAEAAYRLATSIHAEQRNSHLIRVGGETEAAMIQAMVNATDEAHYYALTAAIQARHDDAIADADAEFARQTRVPREALNAEMSRINFAYRKAAVIAFEKLRSRISPRQCLGAMIGCSECLGKYRPRVRERLVREGVFAASVAIPDVTGNMLL